MTKRAAPYEAAPDPHAQLTLRRPDLSQQCLPRASGHRQHYARPVGGVPHHDPGHGSTDLYALPAVGAAVSALTPVGADPFHSSSAILAIRSREARTCSASVCIALKVSHT